MRRELRAEEAREAESNQPAKPAEDKNAGR
jgi:hypothetical protein